MTANILTDKEKIARIEAIRARITEVLARGVKRGEMQIIANEFGITKQYVSQLKHRFTDEHYRTAGKRGRRREIPFTEYERQEFAIALRSRPPVKGERHGRSTANSSKKTPKKTNAAADSPDAKPLLWTVGQARRWFMRTFGRAAQLRQLSAFAAEIGVTFAKDERAPQSEVLNWTGVFLGDDFRRWQATPQAEKLRERDAKLKKIAADRLKNATAPGPRKRGRPRKFVPGAAFDSPVSEAGTLSSVEKKNVASPTTTKSEESAS
ncbi:MAG: hypothetical protein LBV54_07025 [Puniceicoccales bacterium]|nr:hypothetical protein [Puniceicoccales bacterium]